MTHQAPDLHPVGQQLCGELMQQIHLLQVLSECLQLFFFLKRGPAKTAGLVLINREGRVPATLLSYRIILLLLSVVQAVTLPVKLDAPFKTSTSTEASTPNETGEYTITTVPKQLSSDTVTG